MRSNRLSICRRTLVACHLVLFCLGCGGSGTRRYEVSGLVTFDGQPVTNGNIGLVPIEGQDASTVGADLVDGRFTLHASDGPAAGKYKVVIYAERPSGRQIQADEGSAEMVDFMVQYIPAIYNQRTTLTAEIAGDRDDLDFHLEKPRSAGKRRR